MVTTLPFHSLHLRSMNDLKITLVQTDLHWEQATKNRHMFDKKLEHISETDLIVLPEMFSTGFSMQPEKFAERMNGETVEWMKRKATEKNSAVCGSVMIKDNNHYYNRFVVALKDGSVLTYDKRHLFGLGDENNHYSAGKQQLIFELNGWKILPLICYDLRFPVWSRNKLIEGKPLYDILLYVANWPEKRKQAWKTLLPARAIENQSYVVAVNRVGMDGTGMEYHGNSMLTDSRGQHLFHNEGDEVVYQISLSKEMLNETRNSLPFLKDADKFSL